MFFLIPAAYGSIVGVIVLIASLLIKKFHKRSTSFIPIYIGMIIGIGTIVYSIKVVRGFEGASIGLVGLTIIVEH
ncbi:YesK family protein [Niallia circulans]|uniref:Uncharacterized protein n=1 Tax=Niallia circulans TaxID=1397 RepID=A0A941GIX1_NIACI|nr:YesK family protein [Niallia circulans]MCB5238593.1 hypothetical protein [Niallia circulans]